MVSSRTATEDGRHDTSPAETDLGLSSTRQRAARALASLERLADRRLGAVVLFAVAIAIYAIRAIGWPLVGGRDLDEYMYDYIQFLDWHPLLPWSMLFRTPVTPLVVGPALDVAGGFFAEPLMAVLFAGSVVAWATAARAFGARVALLVAAALLVYPAYGLMFHELSSEPVFAAAFAGWALLVTRAAMRPSVRRFAYAGLGVALLALVRPGNALLLDLSVLRRALLARRTTAVARPNYTRGMLQAERLWKWVALHDYFAGNFMWTGVDYLGEASGRSRVLPPAQSTSPVSPRTPTTCTRACGRTDQCSISSTLELGGGPSGESRAGLYKLHQRRAVSNGRSMGEKRLEFPAQGTSGGWNITRFRSSTPRRTTCISPGTCPTSRACFGPSESGAMAPCARRGANRGRTCGHPSRRGSRHDHRRQATSRM